MWPRRRCVTLLGFAFSVVCFFLLLQNRDSLKNKLVSSSRPPPSNSNSDARLPSKFSNSRVTRDKEKALKSSNSIEETLQIKRSPRKGKILKRGLRNKSPPALPPLSEDDEFETKDKNSSRKSYFHFLRESKRQSSLSSSSSTSSAPMSLLPGYINLKTGKPYSFPKFATCAIVSSSGQLVSSGTGNEIDAADCVIRMNAAPVKGFESDVGTRTTIRVISHTSVRDLLANLPTVVAAQPDLRLLVQWGPNEAVRRDRVLKAMRESILEKEEFARLLLFSLSQEELESEDEAFERETGMNRDKSGSFLSTGWFTMSFARRICQNISVYGMVSDDHCRRPSTRNSRVPYHYYEPRGVTECAMYRGSEFAERNVHRFMTEKRVFRRWARSKDPPIQFLYPTWR